VGDLVELLARRPVEVRVVMAVDVAPERGGAVDVAVAVDVEEVDALAALDHQWLFLAPTLLLGEGVPDELLVEPVEAGDISHRRNPSAPRIALIRTTIAL
jgi:hypothetical protein